MKRIDQSFVVRYTFPVVFTRDVFSPHNTVLTDILLASQEKPNRMLVVIDSNVAGSNPNLVQQIEAFSRCSGGLIEFAAPPLIIRGGEICKNEPIEVETIRALTVKHHICRHSFIIAIGGGAVLDAAGYAAATAHRGIRLIRMPTTTLAQNDSGVGVKNGVNAFGRKNYVGTFVPPYAVINDFDFLETLPARFKRAGIAEAVKVALIKDRAFFDYLHRERMDLALFDPEKTEQMIIRCAEIHLDHICGGDDPFETGTSRPLDFGHWCAHHIEELTCGEVTHGEAVAMGVALDSFYSYRTGRISKQELHLILDTLQDIGFVLAHTALESIDVDGALQAFREHLGGELTITLLEGIGKKVDVHDVDRPLMRQCIRTLLTLKKGKESDHEYRVQREKRKRDH